MRDPDMSIPLRRDNAIAFQRENYEKRKQLAEQFAIAAREYAEVAVAYVTLGGSGDYLFMRKKAKEAQRCADAAFMAFEEHIDSHRCSDSAELP